MQLLRIIGFLVLIIVLFASLFKFQGADLTNNVTAIALMVLLLSIFSDLKEFNFWGLTGKRDLKRDLKKLEGKKTVDTKKLPKVSKAKVQQAKMVTEVIPESGSLRSNFLETFFDIERLLRIVATFVNKEPIPASMGLKDIVRILGDKAIMTDEGIEAIQSLITLKDAIIKGDEKISSGVVESGITIATDMHSSLKDWLENPS